MKPTGILCADLHLRDSQPSCRTDDFWAAQLDKMDWLAELQAEHDCPVLCSGDYFHHWKSSPRLLSACIERMPFVYTIPGNHDLPSHSLDLIEKSGLWTLQQARKISALIENCRTEEYNERSHWQNLIVGAFPYGAEIKNINEKRMALYKKVNNTCPKVAIVHMLINHPQASATAKALMGKLKNYDLILTGDNHQTFTESNGKQLLVNPGSISRQTAEQVNHKPCVFLWYAEDNSVQQVFIPIKKRVISRKHLKQTEERNERMQAFLDALPGDSGPGITRNQAEYNMLSYEDNLKFHIKSNKVIESVAKLIWESVEA